MFTYQAWEDFVSLASIYKWAQALQRTPNCHHQEHRVARRRDDDDGGGGVAGDASELGDSGDKEHHLIDYRSCPKREMYQHKESEGRPDDARCYHCGAIINQDLNKGTVLVWPGHRCAPLHNQRVLKWSSHVPSLIVHCPDGKNRDIGGDNFDEDSLLLTFEVALAPPRAPLAGLVLLRAALGPHSDLAADDEAVLD